MKRILSALSGLAALVLVSACEESPGSAGGGQAAKSGWLDNLEAGMKEAKASNKPILIDFGAEW